jgi:hypothetical protein
MRIGGESPSYEMVPVPAEPRAPQAARPGNAPTFASALRGVGGVVDRGEALIAAASSRNLGGLDSGQLIALQAGIYRYSEAVDLVAKLVDRAATAVKTVVSPH